MMEFQAFWVEKGDDGVSTRIVARSTEDLPSGDVLVRVRYSSVNYKDAMSAKGIPGVTRNYPHTPGIDAAGVVVESRNKAFREGDEVIVLGFDLGMNTPGGFGQYVRVPAGWVTPLPAGLSLRESMVLGTAGLTAALCLAKLERMGATPADGPVIVTGATGGVGSVAVSLLARAGFEVHASTGKAEKVEYLQTLGASTVAPRDELSELTKRPLSNEDYAHGIDTVGGEILTNVIKRLKYGGSVAICGLVAAPTFTGSVLPFILRGVNVLGIDSVQLPIEEKTATWQRLASDWKPDNLGVMDTEVDLGGIAAAVDSIFAGQVTGRTVVNLD